MSESRGYRHGRKNHGGDKNKFKTRKGKNFKNTHTHTNEQTGGWTDALTDEQKTNETRRGFAHTDTYKHSSAHIHIVAEASDGKTRLVLEKKNEEEKKEQGKRRKKEEEKTTPLTRAVVTFLVLWLNGQPDRLLACLPTRARHATPVGKSKKARGTNLTVTDKNTRYLTVYLLFDDRIFFPKIQAFVLLEPRDPDRRTAVFRRSAEISRGLLFLEFQWRGKCFALSTYLTESEVISAHRLLSFMC